MRVERRSISVCESGDGMGVSGEKGALRRVALGFSIFEVGIEIAFQQERRKIIVKAPVAL